MLFWWCMNNNDDKKKNKNCIHAKYNQVVVIGQMDNTIDHTFESANRVYSKYGLCPTIPTCAGGHHQPKILVRV